MIFQALFFFFHYFPQLTMRLLFLWGSKINGIIWTTRKPVIDPLWVLLAKICKAAESLQIFRLQASAPEPGKVLKPSISVHHDAVCYLPLSSITVLPYYIGTSYVISVAALLFFFFLWHSDPFHKRPQPDIHFQSHKDLIGLKCLFCSFLFWNSLLAAFSVFNCTMRKLDTAIIL